MLTEDEFINQFWAYCKGCEIHDTAHTIETEVMRGLFRMATKERDDALAKLAAERERCALIADSAPDNDECCGVHACNCRCDMVAKKIREGT